ncbi:hypothetical protein ACH5RR_004869 [Cinchona calisaya]|uniref:Uncharacterized protein n=1 Tax=Cinchona calisaya TaxID=153742 RepID=A0ABD3AYV8_9GENT
MAVVLSLNSNLHRHNQHHFCSATNSSRRRRFSTILKSPDFCFNPLIHRCNLSLVLGQRRCCTTRIVNSSDKEKKSLQTNSQDDEEMNDLGVKAALSVLRFYKSEISPWLPKSCRFVPTCSEYSMIAYKKYGFVKGSILTAWRICRCNPLGGSGFDPPRWFDETRPTER